MSFFDKILSKNKAKEAAPVSDAPAAPTPAVAVPSVRQFTVASHNTAKEFGKVNVTDNGERRQVDFTILMEPEGRESEGWQTGVAIDASASMKEWFGRRLLGTVPPEAAKDYEARGLVRLLNVDGKKAKAFEKTAYEDAIEKGYLRFSPNIVEPLAQEFVAYLAGNLDADGGATVIYWACGTGAAIDVVGDFTEEQCRTLAMAGPSSGDFGAATALQPAMRYFVDRFHDAPRGMYIFITDGRLDDLDDVKRYTTELAHEIAQGTRNAVKCVLVGVGNEIDESQMEELDNLDTGTDVDIWDHKIAKEMRSLLEIFAEVVDENKIVAPTAAVFDSNGNSAKIFSDGLPAKAAVLLPAGCPWFELEVAGRRIRQELAE